MRAPPLRRLQPAPSAGLLRFLRHQSEQLFVEADASRRGGRGPSPAARSGRSSSAVCVRMRRTTAAAATAAVTALQPGHGMSTTRLRPFSTSAAARGWRRPASSSSSSSTWYDRFWEGPWPWRRRGPGAFFGGDGGGDGGDGFGGRGPTLLPGDLPDHGAGAEFASVMFNTRRLQTAKAALEPRLRCTEVDENGAVILADGEFKKTELIAKYGLLPRDLRKIDSSNLPHILVRPAAILLNLLHLKVLIKADRVLLFDVYGSQTSYPQSAFVYDLQSRLQQKPAPGTAGHGAAGSSGGGGGMMLPYEFRALEAVLLSVTSELEAEFDTVREPVIRILSELEADITRDKLRVLLVLSKKVSTFEQKAKLVRDAIEELLEADDDLAAMYLTEKAHDIYRGEDDHTEVEMLLESYHKICDEVAQEAASLVSSIRNTEEIVRAILDANRNALMLLDLKFSIGTLGLAMGTFLAGLYGMNLENFIEETNWGFGTVTGLSFAFSLLVCWFGLGKLRKAQRVTMHGAAGAAAGGAAAAAAAAHHHAVHGGLGLGLGLGLGPVAAAAAATPLAPPTSLAAGLARRAAAASAARPPLDARSRDRLRRLGMMREAFVRKKYY